MRQKRSFPVVFIVAALVMIPCASAQDANTYPKVVKTSPAIGATDVDSATTELRLEFDQAMQNGMSWTGGGDVFPKLEGKPVWETDKVCVATVTLEAGKFYRVGVNASSYRNFKSVDGKPCEFNVLYFVTAGASDEEKAKAVRPNITKMLPAKDAADVDAATTELVVGFDREMGAGLSWTKAGGVFPDMTGKAAWNSDKTECRLPVKIEPRKTYTLGINHPFANNFQSKWGVPVEPVVWSFRTAAE